MDVQSSTGIRTLMRIVFRTDASLLIGIGHVMRCLTLADALRKRGAHCAFICREHSGHLLDLIEQRGHEVFALPVGDQDFESAPRPVHSSWLGTDWESDATRTHQALGQHYVDCLIVDHYALDRNWEQAMRPYCRKLMVIDDLADRQHDCDLLLDQNLGRAQQDYRELLAAATTSLIGPQFALLRAEFQQWREYSLARRVKPQLRSLLITMGGVDYGNATGQLLLILKSCDLPHDVQTVVVMGANAPWLSEVRELAEQMPCTTRVLVGVSNMAELMAESDLVIGAAGSTSWERCCLGVPALMLVLADNQRSAATNLYRAGAAAILDPDIGLPIALTTQFSTLKARKYQDLATMSACAAAVTDGSGTEHVVEALLNLF